MSSKDYPGWDSQIQLQLASLRFVMIYAFIDRLQVNLLLFMFFDTFIVIFPLRFCNFWYSFLVQTTL